MESIALGSRDILCCRKFFLFLLRLTGVVKQKKWRVDSFFSEITFTFVLRDKRCAPCFLFNLDSETKEEKNTNKSFFF